MRAFILICSILATGCVGPIGHSGSPPPAEARVAFAMTGVGPTVARGLADRATGRRVAVDDPVRLASISKLIVGIGVMRLAEAGKLDLDADVSDLLGWRLRNPAYPDVRITLRLLLSHRSSLRDGIDYALPFDASLRDELARPTAWDSAHRPGAWFHYTNLNFPVVAAMMEAATGERFDRLMRRLVFDPLGIDACYNWPTCSDGQVARAVVLYDAAGQAVRDDNRGGRPACPIVPARDGSCDLERWRPGANGASFSPQGGARVSMRDLAKIGRLLLGDGAVDGIRLLSPASVAAMRARSWLYDGANGDSEGGFYCAYGLATQLLGLVPGCNDDLFGDGRARFGHAGEAYGVRSGLWIDAAAGAGVAFFVSSVPDAAPRGSSAYTAVEERMARGRRVR